MPGMPQPNVVTTSDLLLLAYARHMAKTARSKAARNLFEMYAARETHRLETNGDARKTVRDAGGRKSQSPVPAGVDY